MQLPFTQRRKTKYSKKRDTQGNTLDSTTITRYTKNYHIKKQNNKFSKIDSLIDKIGVTQTLFLTLLVLVGLTTYIVTKIS